MQVADEAVAEDAQSLVVRIAGRASAVVELTAARCRARHRVRHRVGERSVRCCSKWLASSASSYLIW